MVKKVLYTLKGYHREDFNITGYSFGSGDKAACIVGAIRGNEYQQMYICSQLIKVLGELEERGQITSNNEILVVPCLNPYSVNVQKRFWAMDNSDINRRFPGIHGGDTTQNIAADFFYKV